MRAALYARFSTDLQSATSIEDQVRVCQRLIEGHGWTVSQIYSDMGMSGATHLRPGYQKLLEDARARAFDVVVAESIDRISRDQEHIAAFHKQMSFQGIPVITVAEGPISELHIGLKGTMSALFLKDLAQKTHRGLEGRVRQGKAAGGLSYGYRLERALQADGTFTTGERSIHPEEASIVRRIFAAFAEGKSPRAIAAMLNKDGIPGPSGTTWGASTIYGNWRRGTGILNNELYIGKLVWNRQRFVKDPATGKRQARPNPPEAWIIQDVPELRIVADTLWERVKARQQSVAVEDSSFGAWDRRRPRYLFSGLMVCGCCGSGYAKVGANRFGCSAARNKGSSVCNNRATISQADVEARVLHGLQHHLMDPELVRVFCEEYTAELNRLRSEAGAQRGAKAAELERVKRDHAKLVDAIVAGVPGEQVKDRMIALDTRRRELEAELSASPAPEPIRLHPGMAEVYRHKVRELAEGLADPSKNLEVTEAIRALVDRIVLTPSAEDPRVLMVDLEGVLAQLLWLGLDHKDQTGARGTRTANNTKAAPHREAASLQSKLVAGAGFEPAAFRL